MPETRFDPPALKVLRKSVRLAARAAALLGGAALDVAVLAGKLAADAVSGCRWLYVRRSATRSDASPGESRTRLAAITAERRSRWQPWTARPLQRRLAAWGLLAIAFVAAVAYSRSPVASSAAVEPVRAPHQPVADKAREGQAALAFDTQRASLKDGGWAIAPAPLIARGSLGAWDDFKIGSPVMIVEESSWLSRNKGRYRLWYRGCHLLGTDYTCGVGYAVSDDGVRWTKSVAPVFVPADQSDRGHLAAIALARVGSQYSLWYSVDPDWPSGRTHGILHLATSTDGVSWKEQGALMQTIDEDSTDHLSPEVLYDRGAFHMWYTDHLQADGDRMIIHATSRDGRAWTVAGSTPLGPFGDHDPGRLSVTAEQQGYRAWFAYNPKGQKSGRTLGTCTSADGSTWQQCAPVADFELPGHSRAAALAPLVRRAPDGLWVVFAARPEDGAEQITVAFRKGA